MGQLAKSFFNRASIFLHQIKFGEFPNASSLSKECGCSENTAQRTIYRLRDEYLVPLEYDSSKRGYYLQDPAFQLPSFLPAGKDEIVAMLLARELLSHIDVRDLHQAFNLVWTQVAGGNPAISRDLGSLVDVFSSDSTAVFAMADAGLMEFVAAAQAGETAKITYKSPWRHLEEQEYLARVLKAHFSDGALYLLTKDVSGKLRVLNAAFVKSFEVDRSQPLISRPSVTEERDSGWLSGFGIWAGEAMHSVEVSIGPPASHYYSAQRWNENQVDRWEGDVLVRSFPSMLSPELVRRLLSLGRHLRTVRPVELARMLAMEAKSLLSAATGDP